MGELYPRHEKRTKNPAETTGNRYKIEFLMSRTQKLKGLSAASLRLKTLNDNPYFNVTSSSIVADPAMSTCSEGATIRRQGRGQSIFSQCENKNHYLSRPVFLLQKTVKMLILQQRDRDTELRDYPTLLFPNVPKRNAKETIRYLPRVLFLDSR